MIKRAKRSGATLIVADPRKIELAEEADVYMQITPGANIALINAMCQVIIEEDLWDKEVVAARCDEDEFEDLRTHLENYTPEAVEDITGVAPELVRKAARMFAEADGAGTYYAMGITQHTAGTHGVMSLSNLALITVISAERMRESIRSEAKTTCRAPATWAVSLRSTRLSKS